MALAPQSPALRRLQRIGIPVGFVLLTLAFVAAGFPYDRIRDVVAARASAKMRSPLISAAPLHCGNAGAVNSAALHSKLTSAAEWAGLLEKGLGKITGVIGVAPDG